MNCLLETIEHDDEGIGGFVTFGNWQTVLLNYLPRLSPDAVMDMQRHTETDEVFILLMGHAILFLAEGDEGPEGQLQAKALELGKLYRVPKGVWHTQVLTQNAKIALVENRNTVAQNSPRSPLNDAQRGQLKELARQLWACAL